MASVPDFPGREDVQPVDLSPAVTTVAFNPILPLSRVPIPAGEEDDPSKGPYVLAFKDAESWRLAWHKCEEKVFARCEAGARMGCSISAAKACRPPWWKVYLLPFLKKTGHDEAAEREVCEEREMTACLTALKEKCLQYSCETCQPVFANMRIAAPGQTIDLRFTGKKLPRRRITRHDKKLVGKGDGKKNNPNAENMAKQAQSPKIVPVGVSSSREIDQQPSLSTNFRGKELMGEETFDWRRRESTIRSNVESKDNPSSTSEPTAAFEGWVGGLVWPKVELRKPDPGIADVPTDHPEPVTEESNDFWQNLQRNFRGRFKF